MQGLIRKAGLKSLTWLKSKAASFVSKKTVIVLALFALSAAIIPEIAFAGVAETFTQLFGSLLSVLINFLGGILVMLINIVISVFSYNGFLSSQIVTIGWPLVRDLCNMFFVIVLLIISFGTILNIQNYHYKSTLFKLLLAAILVNFSKTIMGFVIDFTQVIMLTFVNAFKDAAAVNLASGFGMQKMLNLNLEGEVTGTSVLVTMMTAIVFLVVACGVMLAYAVVLLWRIFMLWALVAISPIAFLLGAIPGSAGTKYSGEFWQKFTTQLTTGIVMAFFMWLTLTIVANVDGNLSQTLQTGVESTSITTEDTVGSGAVAKEDGPEGSWQTFFSFLVTIGLLVMALQYGQQAGGVAGAFAGKVSGGLAAMGKGALRNIPGVKGVRETAKSYWSQRKASQDDRYKAAGAALLGKEAALRSLPGKGLNAIGAKNVTNVLTGKSSQAKADQATKAVNVVNEFQELRNQFTNAKGQAEKDKIKDKINVLLNNNRELVGNLGLQFDGAIPVVNGKLELNDAKLKNNSAQLTGTAGSATDIVTEQTQKAKSSKRNAALLAGGAAFLGTVTGVRGFNKTTGAYADQAQNYYYNEMKKAKESYKDKPIDEVKRDYRDPTKTNAERSAAYAHLLEKGELTDTEITNGRTELISDFKADKKTISLVDNLIKTKAGHLSSDLPTDLTARNQKLTEDITKSPELISNSTAGAKEDPEWLLAAIKSGKLDSVLASDKTTDAEKKSFALGFAKLFSTLQMDANGKDYRVDSNNNLISSVDGEEMSISLDDFTKIIRSATKASSGGKTDVQSYLLNDDGSYRNLGSGGAIIDDDRIKKLFAGPDADWLIRLSKSMNNLQTESVAEIFGANFEEGNISNLFDRVDDARKKNDSNAVPSIEKMLSQLTKLRSVSASASPEDKNLALLMKRLQTMMGDNKSKAYQVLSEKLRNEIIAFTINP